MSGPDCIFLGGLNFGHGLRQSRYICKTPWIHDVLAICMQTSVQSPYCWFCSSFRRCDALVEDCKCVSTAFSADRKLEEEQRLRREQGREADKAGRGGKDVKDHSYRASQRTNQRDLPPHTHHSRPANQSSRILDPSSLIQLLIHGSVKQMWGDASKGRQHWFRYLYRDSGCSSARTSCCSWAGVLA